MATSNMISSLRLAGSRLASSQQRTLATAAAAAAGKAQATTTTGRAMHTNNKVSEYNINNTEREEILGLQMQSLERHQQQMQAAQQIKESFDVSQLKDEFGSSEADAAAWLLKHHY